MATRRLTAAERAGATDTGDAEFLPYDADLNYDADTEDALLKLRDSFAGSETKGTMWVYRLPTDERGEVIGNAKPTMLFNAPLDRFEPEELSTNLRRDYMQPGERAIFRITATVRGTQGMKLNRLLILQRENTVEKEAPQRESFADLMRLVQESNTAAAERTERLLTAFTIRAQSTPTLDPMDAAMKMMTVMTGMTQALVARVAPNASPSDPMASLQAAFVVMKQMQQFMGGQGGEGEDPDSPVAILKAAGPIASVVGQLLNRAPVALPAPASARRRMPPRPVANPAAIATPSNNPSALDAQDKQMLAQILPQLEALTKSASQGADALAVAQVVLEAFEPDSPEESRFMAFLERPLWWELLCGVYPAAVPHAVWFAKLREAILAEFDAGADAPAT